ncbi:hypothetical protein MPH_09348 [Macrophomina phaseolina MS6]|uniref:Uncharacterized protein n=2 Tax=Macrophomina phaseolina TaxID=35725 RepID=K2QV22_MACPH|nr:hypothetical protein MPH_09348 [Macrophomina phaseolina MS6]KAH7043276.1 hypothetical protein B0J12DRAFT_629298 [Macrophomina phaseolina]
MSSNVGSHNIYEDGDQRNYSSADAPQPDRFHEGKTNSHQALDSKDERSIANKLAREEKREKESEPQSFEHQQLEKDATLPARSHGNNPSKGASIDQQLREEDEQAMKGKGSWGSKQ